MQPKGVPSPGVAGVQAALTTFQKKGLKAMERMAAMKPESVMST